MSNTVQTPVSESAEREAVRRSVDDQFPLVAQLLAEGRPKAPTGEPETWSFIDRKTGALREVTCLPGCELDHEADRETPTFAEDIYCLASGENVTLPVNTGNGAEEMRFLQPSLRVQPFSRTLAERMPFVDIEVLDDEVLECLDPDGLETVIRTLSGRLSALRVAHAQLVAARATYRGRA